ncbi:hypothetical protein A1O1_05398 [Capronia coronata CBS 617.96]|uniref:Uncharacterized protein n=1 Tax=Capronia coronata CBS 617.96 TaxID=1182541 RepID=W9Y7H4_9EURO|nr:uncharacterized protein A1O1_05398 [Capronia coronata CBS 617.96]EXJ88468.1 hypothetical protein A1O1_05398 [Capronia coronata CBS 617.96]
MCGDSHLPPARESGDLIAVIHPTELQSLERDPSPNETQRSSTFRGRLRLSNRRPGATISTLQCESDGESDSDPHDNGYGDGFGDRRLHVRIHKFGQPLTMCYASAGLSFDTESISNSSNPVLHSFFVDLASSTSTTGDVRLNLGVGGDGVVGRTVSISDGHTRRVLGEGVIGWS